jgi:hypothetical protein
MTVGDSRNSARLTASAPTSLSAANFARFDMDTVDASRRVGELP